MKRGHSFSPSLSSAQGDSRTQVRPGQWSLVTSAALWGAGGGWEEPTQPDEPSLLLSPTTKQSLQEVYNPPLTLWGVMQEGSISKQYPPNSALSGSEPDQLGTGGQHLSLQVFREKLKGGRISVILLPGS